MTSSILPGSPLTTLKMDYIGAMVVLLDAFFPHLGWQTIKIRMLTLLIYLMGQDHMATAEPWESHPQRYMDYDILNVNLRWAVLQSTILCILWIVIAYILKNYIFGQTGSLLQIAIFWNRVVAHNVCEIVVGVQLSLVLFININRKLVASVLCVLSLFDIPTFVKKFLKQFIQSCTTA